MLNPFITVYQPPPTTPVYSDGEDESNSGNITDSLNTVCSDPPTTSSKEPKEQIIFVKETKASPRTRKEVRRQLRK